MDSFYASFSTGAWYMASWEYLTHILFLAMLLLIYTLPDYRRAAALVFLFAAAAAVGSVLSKTGLFSIRPQIAVFALPALTALLALFNIFGAGNKPSALLEKTGYAMAILFALVFGLSLGNRSGDGAFETMFFLVGLAAGTLVIALIILCITSLAAFFNINRRDFVMVISAVAIGVMIPYLVRYFPFTLR